MMIATTMYKMKINIAIQAFILRWIFFEQSGLRVI